MPSIKTPAEMRELLSKTTQGYWQARRAGNCRLLSGALVGQSSLHPVPRPYEPRWVGYSNEATALQWHHTTVLTDEDADFIAAAHNSMSHYLDRIEEMEKALRQLADADNLRDLIAARVAARSALPPVEKPEDE